MESSKAPSLLTMSGPSVKDESAPGGALPALGSQPIMDMSDRKASLKEFITIIPQRTFLPIVDEEGSTSAEDIAAKAALEEKDLENDSSGAVYKPVSEASYKGKRDPFANEGGGGIKYKTMAWWYVKFIYTLNSISRTL